MDLSKHTLQECLDFIEKEGYTIKNYIHKNSKKNNYTLLYICDCDNDMNVNDTAKQYNQFYECIVGKFDSIDDLEIQLNVWDHGSRTLAIGIFYKNTNKTIKYNINNFNTNLDIGDKLTDKYKSKNNICYNCEINKSIGISCDFCLRYKICSKCVDLKLFKSCICGCKLRSCPDCIKNKFTKCCNHNDNYYYNKHKVPLIDCIKCIHKKIYDLSKSELTDISRSYLMEFIAQQIDLLNDEEYEENKDILNKLEEIYDTDMRKYSYCIYKDSDINKTNLYVLSGYILDKDLSDNDLFVKKIILNNLIKYYNDYYHILSLEELKKFY